VSNTVCQWWSFSTKTSDNFCALILFIQTLALYKSFTYLLAYWDEDYKSSRLQTIRLRNSRSRMHFVVSRPRLWCREHDRLSLPNAVTCDIMPLSSTSCYLSSAACAFKKYRYLFIELFVHYIHSLCYIIHCCSAWQHVDSGFPL